MRIIELRAKVSTACFGAEGYDAEAMVEENGKIRYVHLNRYDGMESCTVSEVSVYGLLAEDEYDIHPADMDEEVSNLEEYERIEETGKSAYAGVFKRLAEMIEAMYP